MPSAIMHTQSVLYIISVFAFQSSISVATPQTLPTVDLGYHIHQAIDYNSTGQYYNFTVRPSSFTKTNIITWMLPRISATQLPPQAKDDLRHLSYLLPIARQFKRDLWEHHAPNRSRIICGYYRNGSTPT